MIDVGLVGNIELAVTFAILGGLIIDYNHLSGGAWRRLAFGRHVMVFMVSLMLVAGVGVARWVGGASLATTWFQWVRAAIYATVPVVLIQRWWLMRREYRALRDQQR